MGLLGDIRQESGDEEYPYRQSPFETQRRHAPALLLRGLPPSPNVAPHCKNCYSFDMHENFGQSGQGELPLEQVKTSFTVHLPANLEIPGRAKTGKEVLTTAYFHQNGGRLVLKIPGVRSIELPVTSSEKDIEGRLIAVVTVAGSEVRLNTTLDYSNRNETIDFEY